MPGEGRTLQVTLTQSLISEYHGDVDVFVGNPGETYFDLKNRTDLVLLQGSTSFNLRVDGNGFVGTDEGSKHDSRVSLEKISLATTQRSFDVTAGDFYVRVGRGLALDLTRIDELVRDTTLRGGQGRIRSRYVNGLVFGGWANPLDMDDFTEVPVRVPSDVIGGARVEVRPRESILLGAQYVGGGLQAQSGTIRNATHSFGATIELPNLARRFSLYGEFNYMSRALGIEVLEGTGTYFSGSGRLGPLTALLEFKFYSHFLFYNDFGSEVNTFVYNRPPTLMRTKAEVINNHDVIGPRLRLDLSLGSHGTVVYANYGQFFRSEARPSESFFASGINVYDAFGGLQQPLPRGALEISGGYRVDLRTDESGQKITDYSQAFVEGELSLRVFRAHTLEVETQYRRTEKSAFQFSDIYLGVSYRPSSYVAAGFSYEYSTEYKDPDPSSGVSTRKHFGGARVTVNFTPSTFARLFGGTTRGGIRCVDGFCREFPPFVGAKLELVAQL